MTCARRNRRCSRALYRPGHLSPSDHRVLDGALQEVACGRSLRGGLLIDYWMGSYADEAAVTLPARDDTTGVGTQRRAFVTRAGISLGHGAVVAPSCGAGTRSAACTRASRQGRRTLVRRRSPRSAACCVVPAACARHRTRPRRLPQARTCAHEYRTSCARITRLRARRRHKRQPPRRIKVVSGRSPPPRSTVRVVTSRHEVETHVNSSQSEHGLLAVATKRVVDVQRHLQ